MTQQFVLVQGSLPAKVGKNECEYLADGCEGAEESEVGGAKELPKVF